jgi:cytochrome c oxidase cbb3-type subunit IV
MTTKPTCVNGAYTMHAFISGFITTLWTPVFVAIFLAILIYAFRPGNRQAFNDAAKMPLRED